ncbi:hypothetical protein EV702DRAFT_11382 [Suillus placidus]|uniref:Uncharacterized protein n=1 Tax=Suillus placidus TaxID=48579 RepID=A0A9P7A8M4_9AGAM|nr:hypothetical protein EV702DRAFT_11382 [Suillus placidus]
MRFAIHPQSTSPHHADINSVLNMTSPINSVFIHITMFFTTPVPMTPYFDCYPVSFVDHAHATQHLAEQRERARALRYQQQPVNQPTPTALLAQEYNEFPDQQRMMRMMCTAMPEIQQDRIREPQDLVALHAYTIEEEQGFARWRAEAENYLSEFLPPDQEPYLSAFQPFDLPDTPVPTSTSNVLVQDEPLLKDGIEDCVMTENRLMAEYQIEVRDTLQSILGCLSAGTSTEVPIKHVPVPYAAAEISSSTQVNVNEEGTTSSQEGKAKAMDVSWI